MWQDMENLAFLYFTGESICVDRNQPSNVKRCTCPITSFDMSIQPIEAISICAEISIEQFIEAPL